MLTGPVRYLGERLKDWVAQLLKALSSGRGLGEGKLKGGKSLFNPPHSNLLPLEKEQSYLCPPSSGCAQCLLYLVFLLTLTHKWIGLAISIALISSLKLLQVNEPFALLCKP